MHEALRRNGIRHSDVAARAGVDRSYVTKMLTGQRRMTPEVARGISQLLREADRRRLHEAAEILEREGRAEIAAEVLTLAAAVA